MQSIGYILDRNNNKKILVLVRQTKIYRCMKKRYSGKDGTHFIDEETYLAQNSEIFNNLKDNQSVIV
jgi:hypothetical protein